MSDPIVDGELFTAVGGADAVGVVVDKLYERLVTDPAVLHYFEPDRLDALKAGQRAWFGAVLLGQVPTVDLATAHAELEITDAQIDAVIGHLAAVLAEVGAPTRVATAIVGIVGRLWHARNF